MFNLKIQEKKGKNAFSILKFIQKSKNEKHRKHIVFLEFHYISSFFLHFQPQNSCKKQKYKTFFLNLEYAKKVNHNSSKKHANKIDAKKLV